MTKEMTTTCNTEVFYYIGNIKALHVDELKQKQVQKCSGLLILFISFRKEHAATAANSYEL